MVLNTVTQDNLHNKFEDKETSDNKLNNYQFFILDLRVSRFQKKGETILFTYF